MRKIESTVKNQAFHLPGPYRAFAEEHNPQLVALIRIVNKRKITRSERKTAMAHLTEIVKRLDAHLDGQAHASFDTREEAISDFQSRFGHLPPWIEKTDEGKYVVHNNCVGTAQGMRQILRPLLQNKNALRVHYLYGRQAHVMPSILLGKTDIAIDYHHKAQPVEAFRNGLAQAIEDHDHPLAPLAEGLGLDQVENVQRFFRHSWEKGPSESIEAYSHYNLGVQYLAEKEVDLARHHFEQALRIKPDNAQSHYYLGIIHSRNKDARKAKTAFNQAVRLNPHHIDAFYQLALLEGKSGNLEKQIHLLQEANRRNPKSADNHLRLGQAYITKKAFGLAAHHLQSAIALGMQTFMAHYGLGVAKAELGHAAEAIESLENAIRLDPTQPVPYDYLSRCHRQLGNLTEAERIRNEFRRKVSGLKQ